MNEIRLQEGHPVDENLRPIKVGGKSTALEVSEKDVRVNNLYVNGTTTGVSASDATKLPLAGGAMTGAITTDSTFDGIDVATRDGVLTSTTTTANAALPKAGGAMTGAITTNSTFDGIDIATRDAILTSTTTTAGAALPKAGGTMTGDITTDSDIISTNLTINDAGTITLDSHTGVFEMKKAGTKFADTYAGTILGYTRIQNDGTGLTDNIITINSSSMTVLQTTGGTDLSIQFIAPPSGNVEIQCSFWMQGSSRGAKFSLSSAASYSEERLTHTYDADYTVYIDETDHDITNISFAVEGLTAGTDTTYYLAGLSSGTYTYINHGRLRLTGSHYPPILMKAIALPATIVTGE